MPITVQPYSRKRKDLEISKKEGVEIADTWKKNPKIENTQNCCSSGLRNTYTNYTR
jgi:hypothetical protein